MAAVTALPKGETYYCGLQRATMTMNNDPVLDGAGFSFMYCYGVYIVDRLICSVRSMYYSHQYCTYVPTLYYVSVNLS